MVKSCSPWVVDDNGVSKEARLFLSWHLLDERLWHGDEESVYQISEPSRQVSRVLKRTSFQDRNLRIPWAYVIELHRSLWYVCEGLLSLVDKGYRRYKLERVSGIWR